MTYIATFHTHLGAMNFRNILLSLGDHTAVMMPVPRVLSSSCGTCVRFQRDFDPGRMYDEDLEKVVRVLGNGYEVIFQNED